MHTPGTGSRKEPAAWRSVPINRWESAPESWLPLKAYGRSARPAEGGRGTQAVGGLAPAGAPGVLDFSYLCQFHAHVFHVGLAPFLRRSGSGRARGHTRRRPQAPFMMRAGKPVAEDALGLSGQPIVALLFGLSLTGREVCSTFVPSDRETEPARRVVIETEPGPRSGGRRCRDRRPRRNGFDGHASLRGSQRRRWAGSREAQSEARNRKAPQRSEKPRFGSRSGAGGICHRERQPDRDPGGRGDFEVVARLQSLGSPRGFAGQGAAPWGRGRNRNGPQSIEKSRFGSRSGGNGDRGLMARV